MAFDYNLLAGGVKRPGPINTAGNFLAGMDEAKTYGLRQDFANQFASGKPDINKMLAGVAGVDPMKALEMYGKQGPGRKKSVFEMKRDSQSAEGPSQILEAYKEQARAAMAALEKNPKAKITPFLTEMGLLEAEYKAKSGVAMATKITGAMIRNAAKERGILETDEDDTYAAVQKVVDKSMESLREDIKAFNSGSPEIKKAIRLMQTSIGTDAEGNKTINPSNVNAAIKIFVKALDDSAVMQGEIAQIAGDSWWGKFKGFINGAFSGVEMSEGQLNNLYDSLLTVAQANNAAIDTLDEGAMNEAKSRMNIAEASNRVGDGASYQESIDDLVNSKLGRYRVRMPTEDQRPDFAGGVVFGDLDKPKGGGTYVDPYADL